LTTFAGTGVGADVGASTGTGTGTGFTDNHGEYQRCRAPETSAWMRGQSMFAFNQKPLAPMASNISTPKTERKKDLRRKDDGGATMSAVGSGNLMPQFRQ